MKKIKNILQLAVCIILVTGIFCILPQNAYAADTENVYDTGALLSDSEITSLDEKIQAARAKTGWYIYMVTTTDAQGKSAMEYADDFFDTHAYGEDGIVLLIDMDNREIYLSTAGKAIVYLTDERIDDILNDSYSYASNGDYSGCFSAMLENTMAYYDKGIDSNQYTYDVETGEIVRYHSLSPMKVLIALLLGFGAAAIVYFVVMGKYRLKFGTYEYNFREFSQMKIKNADDTQVNQLVTHRHIQRDVSTGGRSGGGGGMSSIHTSSGGSSHGGGGHSF